MRWPKHLPSGEISTIPVVGYDLLPTFCHAAGITQTPKDIDGENTLELLNNPKLAAEREIIWHFPFYHPEKSFFKAKTEIGHADFSVSQTRPHSAIRQGSNKLLHFYESDQSELYSLLDESSETEDLSKSYTHFN